MAKICDFGLARDIQNDDSYIVQGNVRVLHSVSLVEKCLKMTINDILRFILKGPTSCEVDGSREHLSVHLHGPE